MSQALIITAWLLPLLITPFVFNKQTRWLLSLATLPAIAAALMLKHDQIIHIPWLLLGTHLGIDEVSRWLLLASAFVWLIASVYAQTQKTSGHFYLFFTMAMAGNFLLLLAMDMVAFYLGFALMGLSTAVLIIEQSTAKNLCSLRLYVTWTIAGELALFCAIVLLASHSQNLRFDMLTLTSVNTAVLLLIVIGFGIKIALPGLHFWMPATYSSLPIAAAAVVSGPMISAGMLGLIRFLTPGSGEHAFIGQVLLVAGSFSACYAVIIGLMQSQARDTLAYSSMSKMGLLAAALGIALIYPAHKTMLIAAIVMFTLHHLLIKSALFFGLGFAEQSNHRIALMAGLVLLIISLAGGPFTSGALTKAQLSAALPNELNHFVIALSVATFISVLLIARVFYLIATSTTNVATIPGAVIGLWWLLIMIIMFWPWWFEQTPPKWSDIAVLFTSSGIAAVVWRFKPPWLTRTIGLVPSGDMLLVISATSKKLGHWLSNIPLLVQRQRLDSFKQHAVQWICRLNTGLLQIGQLTMTWRSAGVIWLIIGVVMFIVIFIGVGAINVGEKL